MVHQTHDESNLKEEITDIEEARRTIKVLEQKLKKERQQSEMLRMERDKILDFWDVTKVRLTNVEEALRTAHLMAEECKLKHCIEQKMYQNKIMNFMSDFSAKELNLMSQMEEQKVQIEAKFEMSLKLKEQELLDSVAAAHKEAQEAKERHGQISIECEREKKELMDKLVKKIEELSSQYDEQMQESTNAAEERCQHLVELKDMQKEAEIKTLKEKYENIIDEIRGNSKQKQQAQMEVIGALQAELSNSKRQSGLEPTLHVQPRLGIIQSRED